MKMNLLSAAVLAACAATSVPSLADQGPSTRAPPYVLPLQATVTTTSILTTGDVVGGYKMGGVPDGLGAYDNEDGTFTVLMNQELSANAAGPLGLVRAHGGAGAYVSEWVIRKDTLEVVRGADLMKTAYQRAADGSWAPLPAVGVLGQTASFARFCSADLASRSAFFHKGKGTKQRIFLNGEESAPTYQRGVAHVATGPNKGRSYVLPWAAAANASWENLLASPNSGDKTVVIGNADGGTNGVYVYVGTKSNQGNEVERAGLVDGALWRVAVNHTNLAETRGADAGLGLVHNATGRYEGAFTLVAGPDATNSVSTRFQRPEDGAWDTVNPNRFYLVTTDQVDAAKDGTLILQEDVGNNLHSGKIWRFDPKSGVLAEVAGFDTKRFGDIGVPPVLTKDEEASGVIDISRILDRDDDHSYHLFVAQSHAASGDPETIEGGQLLLMKSPRARGRGRDEGDDRRR